MGLQHATALPNETHGLLLFRATAKLHPIAAICTKIVTWAKMCGYDLIVSPDEVGGTSDERGLGLDDGD